MDGRLNGVVYRFDGAVGTITTRFRTISSHTIWQPSGGGLLSMLGRTEIEGYERTQRLATGKTSSTTIDRIHADTRADRTDTARLGALVRASAAMIAAAPPPAAAPGARPMPPSVAQREAMHALTATLGGLLANLDTEQTMEGLQFHSQAFGARIARLELASGIGAPDGAAQIYLRIALQDFESDDIPEGPFRQLLPRRLLLTPRVSGVAKEALLRFLDAAIDASGRPDAQAAATAAWLTMLAGSPATFAIDELALETGTASLTGSMEVEVRSASDVTGGADLRLTGLDALIGLAAANPQLQQAMPVLIILKGIGRQDGAATVWKVAYAGQKVTVNGTDLSALIPRK
jgi:hypothetical protein